MVDNVAVRVKELPDASSIVVPLEVNVTVGATSSSVIVIVFVCVPFSIAFPPDTDEIAITADSLPSTVLSLVGVKLVVPVVLPADIVIFEIFP